MERTRGGQPGNQNARIHGFYSKKLLDDQKQDFEQAALVEGLDEEIALLRVKIKSLVEHDPSNVKLIEQAVKTLARLVLARYNIRRDDKAILKQAFETVTQELILSLGVDNGAFLKWLLVNKQNRAEGQPLSPRREDHDSPSPQAERGSDGEVNL